MDWADPANWDGPLTIPLSGAGGLQVCIVDPEDFEWANQWRWRAHPNKNGLKYYASRAFKGTRLYLHKEILIRKCHPPTKNHCIGDHLDGDSLNNRRSNLRRATPSQNGRNRYGFAVKQLSFRGFNENHNV